MECPDCRGERTRVLDTATSANGTAVRRRRECRHCAFRFTTYERAEWDALQVRKRDGSLEPFDREKLHAGVDRALEKRDVDDETTAGLLDAVEQALEDRDTRVVTSSLVGELVADRLQDVDAVAYLRFVSVYEAFDEPAAFRRELDAILDADCDERDPPGERPD